MPDLFSPLTIRNVNFKNRIVMSPMCQYSSKDGFANDWHIVHYGTRATGGTGLIIVEATAVEPEGRISPGDLGIWSDDHIAALKQVTSVIHKHGAAAGIQIAHAGRKASCAVPTGGGKQLPLNGGGWVTKAPSELPFMEGDRVPHQLSKEEIKDLVKAFQKAAERAVKAGFDVIEIHSAHGYLMHEFLSPLSNTRNDEYGGSFENRTRILLETVKAIRSVIPGSCPLFTRISSTDWTEGGWNLDESVKLSSLLKELGVDLIDCSSGGNVLTAKIPAGPGYQLPFSEAIRKTGILTGTVGFITGAAQADSVIAEGKADLVLLGRELLRNPYFALHAAKELGKETTWPVQYLRAK